MVGRPWRTRAVVPLVAIAMWLTGCGTAFELSDKPAGQLSEWTKCPTSDWQCAELTVPVDYNEPEGPRFNIEVAMQPAESKRKRGVLIWNPGGPGLPAADQIAQFSRNLPTELLNSFDVVSFDPR